MNEPLVPGNDNEESQGLHRSSSLLERIRAQREQEAASSEEQNNHVETNTRPVNIPNYAPIANDAVGGGGEHAAASSWSSGFSSFSMNFSGGGGGGDAAGAPRGSTQGLLTPDGSSPDNYSMTEYFYTFVMDIYGLFRSLPIPAQAVLVVFLLWVAWKLL